MSRMMAEEGIVVEHDPSVRITPEYFNFLPVNTDRRARFRNVHSITITTALKSAYKTAHVGPRIADRIRYRTERRHIPIQALRQRRIGNNGRKRSRLT